MRLVHTADWHLGQTFKGFDRQAEHEIFLDWLVDTLDARDIDALVVAGDIFDHANPSADAQRLFYRFLARVHARCPRLDVVIVAGNHDSPGRLEAPHQVLDAINARVVGSYPGRAELTDALVDRLVLPVTNRSGHVAAHVLAVPFLRAGDLARADDGRYETGLRDAYRRLADAAIARHGHDVPLVALGHLHVVGGLVSEESERRLIVGGEEAVASSVFPEETRYVALGHLHRPQAVGASHIRYSGSPFPLAFPEAAYQHQVIEVEFGNGGLVGTTAIHTPRPVELIAVPATHRRLDIALDAIAALEVDSRPPGLEPFVEVRVMESVAPTDMRARVEAVLDGKNVRLTGISRRKPEVGVDGGDADARERVDLSELRPERLFARRLEECPDLESRDEVMAAFGELLDEVRQEER